MPRLSDSEPSLAELYRRPGFLIRRAQQIAVSLFLEETGELGITNTQFGILYVTKRHPGIDQIGIAKRLGLDRSTTGMVLGKLVEDGLILRTQGQDRRKHALSLSKSGEKMLERLAEPARRAQARVLAPFTPAERESFIALLEKFVGAFNDTIRVPIAATRAKSKTDERRASP